MTKAFDFAIFHMQINDEEMKTFPFFFFVSLHLLWFAICALSRCKLKIMSIFLFNCSMCVHISFFPFQCFAIPMPIFILGSTKNKNAICIKFRSLWNVRVYIICEIYENLFASPKIRQWRKLSIFQRCIKHLALQSASRVQHPPPSTLHNVIAFYQIHRFCIFLAVCDLFQCALLLCTLAYAYECATS